MTEHAIRTWLEGYELTLEQTVYSNLALALAKEFDSKPHTSTAAELRKTVQALGAMLSGNVEEYDPLADLLTR
jgi:hypothetical protein